MEQDTKKKLLILITKSNFGGAQRYVYDLSRSLKNQYDVVVACGGEGLMKERIKTESIRTISIPHLGKNINPLKDLLVFFWLAKIIWKEKPQILHVNSSKIGGAGAFVGRLMRVPKIIFTAHAWAFNEDRDILSRTAIAFFHWLTVVLAHKTIAVSGAVKKQMSHLLFMDKKISVIHLGLESFEPISRNEARAKLGIADESFAIGTIAELHPVKGLPYALDAVKKTNFDCSYRIIGEGGERNSLQKIIDSDPILKKRATLVGFVPDAAKYISAFDVFLLPSISEALGYVLLEAGYAGTPVIATSVGGIPEIIEDMKSGILIHPKNTKEISHSLTFLFENPEIRQGLGQALRAKVSAEFSLSKMVERTVAIYEGK